MSKRGAGFFSKLWRALLGGPSTTASEPAPGTGSKPVASDNRRIRVFVSSTFRDMIAERDELMTHTWPVLRRLCQERHVELVEVDLRWGIAEEQSTRKKTLKLSLDEIRACRPFFIGLLGERCGWIPDAIPAEVIKRDPCPWRADFAVGNDHRLRRLGLVRQGFSL